jgi:hypothetical protein
MSQDIEDTVNPHWMPAGQVDGLVDAGFAAVAQGGPGLE